MLCEMRLPLKEEASLIFVVLAFAACYYSNWTVTCSVVAAAAAVVQMVIWTEVALDLYFPVIKGK